MTANWAQRRMLAFDFESDGINPLEARIVQAACVDIRPADPAGATGRAVEVDRWSTLVWPGDGFEMAPGAQEVHGISTEQCRAEGIPTADAVEYVIGKLYEVWADGGIAVGHNVGGYDCTLLAAEARRLGMAPFEVRGCVVDTLCLDRCDLLDRTDRFRKGSRKLVDAVKHWRVAMDQAMAHDATEDALASARIAWRMAQRYPRLANMPVDELHAYQVKAYAAWAENFEKYLIKKKTEDQAPQEEIDAVHINRDWPLHPDLVAPARDEAA